MPLTPTKKVNQSDSNAQTIQPEKKQNGTMNGREVKIPNSELSKPLNKVIETGEDQTLHTPRVSPSENSPKKIPSTMKITRKEDKNNPFWGRSVIRYISQSFSTTNKADVNKPSSTKKSGFIQNGMKLVSAPFKTGKKEPVDSKKSIPDSEVKPTVSFEKYISAPVVVGSAKREACKLGRFNNPKNDLEKERFDILNPIYEKCSGRLKALSEKLPRELAVRESITKYVESACKNKGGESAKTANKSLYLLEALFHFENGSPEELINISFDMNMIAFEIYNDLKLIPTIGDKQAKVLAFGVVADEIFVSKLRSHYMKKIFNGSNAKELEDLLIDFSVNLFNSVETCPKWVTSFERDFLNGVLEYIEQRYKPASISEPQLVYRNQAPLKPLTHYIKTVHNEWIDSISQKFYKKLSSEEAYSHDLFIEDLANEVIELLKNDKDTQNLFKAFTTKLDTVFNSKNEEEEIGESDERKTNISFSKVEFCQVALSMMIFNVIIPKMQEVVITEEGFSSEKYLLINTAIKNHLKNVGDAKDELGKLFEATSNKND